MQYIDCVPKLTANAKNIVRYVAVVQLALQMLRSIFWLVNL